MDRFEFHRHLRVLARAAALRTSELALWFEQPRSTVSAWMNGERNPGQTIWPGVWERAQLLHRAIYKYHCFPIPSDVHFSQRKPYVQRCLSDVNNPVPKGPVTGERVQMRLGVRTRRIKAPTVGNVR